MEQEKEESRRLLQVFYYFPVKTLLRCRCLSRWHKSLFDDPRFSFNYGYFSASHSTRSRRLFLLFNPSPATAESSAVVSDAATVHTMGFCPFSDKPYSRHPTPARQSFFGGSCLGLLCVAFSPFDVCIWNPSNRTHRHLVPPNFERYGTYRYVNFGLGRDSKRNSKIVRIIFSFFPETRSFIGEACIYEVHKDTWQKINLEMTWSANSYDYKSKETGRNGWEIDKSGVSVSSTIAFMVKHYGSTQNGVGRFTILKLNLNTYKFSEQPVPYHMLEGRSPDSVIHVDMWPFGFGALSFSISFHSEPCKVVIWVRDMRKWSKMLSVEGFCWRLKLLFYNNNKRIVLLQMDTKLVCYDLQNKIYWDSNKRRGDLELYEATVYVDGCDLINRGGKICPRSLFFRFV